MTNENPLAGFMAELEDEDVEARRNAVANIKQYDTERTNETTAKAAKDTAGQVLREFFKTHPDETELVDGEWGLRAYMETRRSKGHSYDLVSIIENHPSLFARLVSVRALQIDHDLAVAAGLTSEIERYELPHGETQALQVKAIK
jgi:hypothetical protein